MAFSVRGLARWSRSSTSCSLLSLSRSFSHAAVALPIPPAAPPPPTTTTATTTKTPTTTVIRRGHPRTSAGDGGGRSWFRFFAGCVGTLGVTSSGLLYLYHYDRTTFNIVTSLPRRNLYTIAVCASIALDYKYTWLRIPEGDPRRDAATSALHQRSAERILSLARHHKGLFIKIGQYMASLNHVLPREYTSTLKVLQDHAPNVGYDAVEECFQLEFGHSPSYYFRSFDPIPLASASLAQVHRAISHNGDDVAVKVQYPGLRRDFDGDMFTHKLLLHVAGYIFSGFDLGWMHEELYDNLSKELDFINEAANSERCAANFVGDRRIHVPVVHWPLTTSRILCMEFVDGAKITDVAALQSMGVAVGDAVGLTIDAMSQQIFWHGFFHADPHPGNILVRPHPQPRHAGDFQVVILDHGLYRQEREKTRVGYCKLWRALVVQDDEEVKRQVVALGMKPEDWELMAVAILMRPYRHSRVGFPTMVTPADVDAMREMMRAQIPEMIALMKRMPRELLLAFRNQNYLRALNFEFGDPVNRFRIMARCAVAGINRVNEDARRSVDMDKQDDRHEAKMRGIPLLDQLAHASGTAVPYLGGAAVASAIEYDVVPAPAAAALNWWQSFRRLLLTAHEQWRFEWNLWWSDLVFWLSTVYLQWRHPELYQFAKKQQAAPELLL